MSDRPRYFWIGIVLAVSITAACTIAAVSSSSGTGRVLPSVISLPTKLPQPPGMPIGLDFGDTLFGADDAALTSGLNDAQALGASWIRVDLPWDGVQPSWSSTTYDWSHFDRLVAAADARGLEVLATLVDPPVWARAAACKAQEACEPAQPQAFAAFAKLAAQRYAPQGVHDWEVWNEENLDGFATSANPEAAYTTMLEDTYTAVHEADAHSLVMLGGLGMVDDEPARHWIGAYDFLSGVGAAGGLAYADAIGVHPYDWNDLPQNAAPFNMIDDSPRSLLSVLQQYGHAGLPFWITETGAPTGGTGTAATGPATAGSHATPRWQAQLATDIVGVETKDPRIAGLFWYTDTDLPDSGLYFGVRTSAGAVKPVFATLTAAIAAYRKTVR